MSRRTRTFLMLLIPAFILLIVGWWHFWFVCDDAYIAFRYIRNRQLGWGYTWNPPPFMPVEGYTSFLWVVLLDVVWTTTGMEPPEAAPLVGLACGAGTLATTAWMAWNVPLSERLEPHRVLLAHLVVLATVTNKTFLTWTSSGLETPLAVMLAVMWTGWATVAKRGQAWAFTGALISATYAITRPEGVLFLLGTAAVILATWRGDRYRRADWLAVIPVALPVGHLLWRYNAYGAWVPNTAIAKIAEPWVLGGGNHFWLFVVEYGLFWWVPLILAAAWSQRTALGDRATWIRALPVLTAFLVHVAYVLTYIFRIGGDHFEFRIYTHGLPLLFVAALWLADRARAPVRVALPVLTALVVLSAVLPWANHRRNLSATDRDQIGKLHRKLSGYLPGVMYPWTSLHDRLEGWCVSHLLATPYQTHKYFAILEWNRYPDPAEVLAEVGPEAWDGHATGPSAYPIIMKRSVGIAGWTLPTIAMIDWFGLNDQIVARNLPPDERKRFSAHDRAPPIGYVPCFRPNVRNQPRFVVKPRDEAVTADTIRQCQAHYLDKMARGEFSEADPEDYMP